MKQEEEEKWISALRNSLEDYSEPPVAGGWELLQKELSPVPVAPRKRSYFMYYAAAAAVALLVVVSTAVIMLLNDSSAKYVETAQIPVEVKQITDKKPLKEVISAMTTDDKKNNELALGSSENTTPTGNKAQVGKVVTRKYVPTPGNNSGSGEAASSKLSAVTSDNGKPATEKSNEKNLKDKATEQTTEKKVMIRGQKEKTKDDSSSESQKSYFREVSTPAEHVTELQTVRRKKSRNLLSIGFTTGNSAGIANENNSDLAAGRLSDPCFFLNGENALLSNVISQLNWNHKQPVSFGLSVRKQLSSQFALESGIIYTRLESEASLGTYVRNEQNLNYIGIPLKLNYLFLNRRFVTLYLSGGGMAEKCVSGETKTINGTTKQSISEDLNVKPLQWSVNGAFGAQFNATRQLGVFIEPGVIYYFNDGSSVETIRKETPFNFNLQFGLRVTY